MVVPEEPAVGEVQPILGQPSVDPLVLFKLLLVAYLYVITSERRLAQDGRL